MQSQSSTVSILGEENDTVDSCYDCYDLVLIQTGSAMLGEGYCLKVISWFLDLTEQVIWVCQSQNSQHSSNVGDWGAVSVCCAVYRGFLMVPCWDTSISPLSSWKPKDLWSLSKPLLSIHLGWMEYLKSNSLLKPLHLQLTNVLISTDIFQKTSKNNLRRPVFSKRLGCLGEKSTNHRRVCRKLGPPGPLPALFVGSLWLQCFCEWCTCEVSASMITRERALAYVLQWIYK